MPNLLSRIFSRANRTPVYLIIDAGTTNIKLFIIDNDLDIKYELKIKNSTSNPKPGWFEQNPTKIYFAVKDNLEKLNKNFNIVACGITNQRETTILWDNKTGIAIYPAITWKDQRVKEDDLFFVKNYLRSTNLKELTGLELSPIYSAAKIRWILNNVEQAKRLLADGRLAFGTVNSWLIFNLSREQNHFTDHTNANHTLLYSLKDNYWSKNLLRIFGVDASILPQIKPNFYKFGHLQVENKEIPILVSIADQQAGLYLAKNKKNINAKLTIGTGIFLDKFIGNKLNFKENLETLIAYYQKEPQFMQEFRFNLNGADLMEAVRSEDEKVLSKFMRELKEKIHSLKVNELTIDGGGMRPDELGNKLFENLQDLPIRVIRPDYFESTALGVAEILRNYFK